MQKQKMTVLAVILAVVALVAYLTLSKPAPLPSPADGSETAGTAVSDGTDTTVATEADALVDFVLGQMLEDDALTAEVEGDADLLLESENDLNAFSEASYDEGL